MSAGAQVGEQRCLTHGDRGSAPAQELPPNSQEGFMHLGPSQSAMSRRGPGATGTRSCCCSPPRPGRDGQQDSSDGLVPFLPPPSLLLPLQLRPGSKEGLGSSPQGRAARLYKKRGLCKTTCGRNSTRAVRFTLGHCKIVIYKKNCHA